MARKRKSSSKRPTLKIKRKAKRKTVKKAARPAAKAKAKRRAKALVKAPKIASGRGKKRPAKRSSGKHAARVKFTKRKRDATDELKIQSLIARVYRKAAEEMRDMEQQAVTAKIDLMRNAAQEMQTLASQFDRPKP